MKTKCKICSNKVQKINTDNDNKIYYYCEKCNFISLDNSFFPKEKDAKKRYLNHNNNFNNTGYIKMFEDFIDKCINQYSDRIQNILDYGCGPIPVLSGLLEKRGYNVDHYDIFFYPEKSHKNKTYDLITATEVFEHLSDPKKTLFELSKHINKQGLLAIMTLFHNNEVNKFFTWWYRHDITHISFYNQTTLKHLANTAGFKIIHIDDKNLCVFEKQ